MEGRRVDFKGQTRLTTRVPPEPPAAYVGAMPARIPLDVDLQDNLLYGLTPTRLAYLVVALLGAFSAWTSHWTVPAARAGVAIVIALIGVVAAWGRWRGRGVDEWAMDLASYLLSEYRLSFRRPHLPRRRRGSTR